MFRSMFWNLVWVENRKNLKRKLLWVELGLLIAFVILVFCGLYIAIQGTPEGVTITVSDEGKIQDIVFWPGSLAFSLFFAARSKLLLIIFVCAVTAAEYTWRTYHLWLSRGVPRSLLLITKFMAFWLPILIVVSCALIAGGTISAIFSMAVNNTLHLEQVNFWALGLDIFRTAYTLLPYVSITFMLAVATRSAVAAIGGCAAYGLIIESLLGETLQILPRPLGEIAKYLPSNLMQSVLSANWTPPTFLEDPIHGLLTPGHAALAIAMITLSLFGVSLMVFKRQDFSG